MEEFENCEAVVSSEEVIEIDGKSNGAADVDHKPGVDNGKLRKSNGPRRSSKANWTEEEDDMLRNAVQKYEGKCWKKIAKCLPGRTDVQCLHRWQNVLNPDLIKGSWSTEEDTLLVELVGKFGDGEKKWSEIAEQLPGRIGKQCRERWNNHLNPMVNKAAWTNEEEEILIKAHAVYGNKWSMLTKFLPGRTDNSIKNHWNCTLKRRSGANVSVISPRARFIEHGDIKDTCNSLGEYPSSLPFMGNTCNERDCDHVMCWPIRPRRHSELYDSWSYSGICYEPIQKADVDIYLSTGVFPSTESYIRAPRTFSYIKGESSDDLLIYRKIKSTLRNAAMNYDNRPSIIRARANHALEKDVNSDSGSESVSDTNALPSLKYKTRMRRSRTWDGSRILYDP